MDKKKINCLYNEWIKNCKYFYTDLESTFYPGQRFGGDRAYSGTTELGAGILPGWDNNLSYSKFTLDHLD